MSKDIKMKTEILIIGGGSIGVCSAHFLNQAGHDVTLVDKDDICAGSSYGNAGLVVPSHSIPLSAPGVWLKGLKWMFNPESPFYIKPSMDKDPSKKGPANKTRNLLLNKFVKLKS